MFLFINNSFKIHSISLKCGLDMVKLGKSQGAFTLNNFVFISFSSIGSLLQSFKELQVVYVHRKVLKDCEGIKVKMNIYIDMTLRNFLYPVVVFLPQTIPRRKCIRKHIDPGFGPFLSAASATVWPGQKYWFSSLASFVESWCQGRRKFLSYPPRHWTRNGILKQNLIIRFKLREPAVNNDGSARFLPLRSEVFAELN